MTKEEKARSSNFNYLAFSSVGIADSLYRIIADRLTPSSWRNQHHVDAPFKKSLEVSSIFDSINEIFVFCNRTIFEWYLVHKLKVLILCKVT